MAFAQVTVFRSLEADEADGILRAVHDSLVDALQVPADDPTVWLTEVPESHLATPNRYGQDTIVVQVTLFSGRTLETKHRLHGQIATNLRSVGAYSGTVTVVLVESPRENWSGAGVPMDQVELDFRIDV